MMLVFVTVCLLAVNAATVEKCVVDSTGYVDVCENGETCTPVGCRCLQNTTSCFHKANEIGLEYRACKVSGSVQHCRSGEMCVKDIGCRCSTNACSPPPCVGNCSISDPNSLMSESMALKNANRLDCFLSGKCADLAMKTQVGAVVPCVNGFAGDYPCLNVDLYSALNFSALGSANAQGNDIWGWSSSGRDFAIVCLTTGTSFVEITDPTNPRTIGFLPTQSGASTWRDAKVFKDYAFIVSEAVNHGMQVFDLSKLLTEANPGPNNRYTADVLYITNMGTTSQRSTHNIAINEQTGYAYLVGCKTCRGGLLMVDISHPLNPTYAGCFDADGYTHDAQCVVYSGPDHRFQGQEICFGLNEDSLTIVDVTDKANPIMLSRIPYYGMRYTHQGWLTDDQRYLVVDDELDEMYNTFDDTKKTVSYVFDVSDLTEPLQIKYFQSPVQSIDHNQYIQGDFVYQSNYASGLRIWNGMAGNMEDASWKPTLVGFFDVHPTENVAQFYGAWSVYPYYTSPRNTNTIVINSIEKGLFVVGFEKANFVSTA